jgi:hypothetical protein
MFRLPSIALLVCAASSFAATSEAPLARAKTALQNLPLRFEVNQGQFDPAVRYAARAGDYKLLLKQRGASLTLPGSQQIELSLLHSNPAPQIEAQDPLSTRTDYFLGTHDNWHAHIANYGRIRYHDVYPGVDMVYYGRQNQLEYDFVLQPGADPAAIRLQFRGARRLSITSDGDVAFESAEGQIVQKRPVIYQEDGQTAGRHEVQGRYVLLSRNVVGLKLDHYDRARKLTIDPILVYSTYFGATLTDQIVAVKMDQHSYLYVVGQTDDGTPNGSANLPATGNTFQAANGGLTDIFIAIFDTTNNNNLLYYSYLGGSNLDIPKGMQIDSNGYVYITGSTTSTDFPVAGNSFLNSGAGASIFAFVAVLNPDLVNGASSLIYSTYLGTNTANSIGNAIDVDAQGNFYVIGNTQAPDFPVTPSAYAGVMFGPSDAFLVELNIYNPNLLYSTFLGGEADDFGVGIAVTPSGLVYFAINTVSSQFPQAGNQYQPNLIGAENIAIGVMDFTQQNNASLLYTTYFGGTSLDEARKIAFDAKGNLLVTGHSLSSDLPVTGDALQLHYGGNGDAFVAVLNPFSSKFVQYLTYLGGAHGEVAYDISGDASGSIYVTGYTLSSDFPVTPNAPNPVWGNGCDTFLTKLKPGTPGLSGLQFSTFLGEATINVAFGLTVGPDGTMYMVGYTGGLWPTTGNPVQPGFGGGYSDGFISAIK